MPARIEQPKTPATDEAIAAAQSAIGLNFPADYRAFLKTFNGGRPEPDSFRIQWRDEQAPAQDWRTSSMGWFYAIGSAVRSSDLVRVNTVTFRDRLPKGTVAIGYDAASNQLLLAVEGPFAGKLLFWCKDHEVPQGQVPGYDNVGVMAEGFQDFLDKLYQA